MDTLIRGRATVYANAKRRRPKRCKHREERPRKRYSNFKPQSWEKQRIYYKPPGLKGFVQQSWETVDLHATFIKDKLKDGVFITASAPPTIRIK